MNQTRMKAQKIQAHGEHFTRVDVNAFSQCSRGDEEIGNKIDFGSERKETTWKN